MQKINILLVIGPVEFIYVIKKATSHNYTVYST